MDPLDLHAFLDLVDEGYNVVPLHITLQLDRETPVSLYQRVGERAIFLLESASLGEETGRYSFIGLDRRWRLSTRDEVTVLESDTYAETDLAPLDELRRLLSTYRTYVPSGLPDFIGGAVGFVTYDYVRRLERLPGRAAAPSWPDVDFSFPDTVLICDHLRHSTTVVVLAVADDSNPSLVYHRAVDRLNDLVALLLGPAPATDETVERLVATAPQKRLTIDVLDVAAKLSSFTKDEYEDVVRRA
ncbi:MAG TPA: hypothetical protein VIH73_06375, partial [Acidimicrobiales bacterium]